MNLCSDCHEEICYEDQHCPFCAYMIDTTDVHEKETEELKTKILELADSLSEYTK